MPRDVRPPPPGALRPAVGEPRRALARARVARGLPRRAERRQCRAGGRARGDGRPLERARGAPRGGRRHSPHALPRDERVAPRSLLRVRRRHAPAAAGPEPVPRLDRVEPHGPHLEGRCQRLPGGGGARLSPRRPLRRRLDDEQALARGIPRGVRAGIRRTLMLRGIDHIVIAVPDLAAAGKSYAALGFTVVPGGRHPVGTHNALIAFGDGSYVELIAFYENNPAHKWWAPLQAGGGLVGFCLQTDDLRGDTEAFPKGRGSIDHPAPPS